MADPDQDDADVLDNDQEGSFCEDGVRRPMNAFFIFCKRHRDVVREKYPHLENRSITKILGEWWANLDASEKSTYTALARQYKEAFMKAHPDFKWYKLPSVPTRTLMTRPSNNRCSLTGKKEKNGEKSSQDDITLEKFAGDMDDSESADLLEPIASNLTKPPKKRYLVNGEFKCKTEGYDSRDDQTQNACSALMELAEICANTANHAFPSSKSSSVLVNSSLFNDMSEYNNNVKPYNTPVSVKGVCNSTISTQSSELSSTSSSYIRPTIPTDLFVSQSKSMDSPDLQDQPLNLCKQKGKMITTSNQQLINHLVDKFLCDPPSPQVKPIPEFSAMKPSSGNDTACQSFTLSEAIESAIDQAYSRSLSKLDLPDSTSASHVTNCKAPEETVTTNSPSAFEKNSDDKTEFVFIDKIKKACLASSQKSREKKSAKRYSRYSSSAAIDWISPDQIPTAKDEHIMQNEAFGDRTLNCSSSSKKGLDEKFSSSKYYSKFASPPKKSQVWCNLFMREQLENSDSDGGPDSKKTVEYDVASPVRRNSQRTCKGRRYKALLTEGLLQSAKERKTVAAKKPFSAIEKCKLKSHSVSEAPLVLKTKKKKKESLAKSKSLDKQEEESDTEKSVFDLNEKIASLPKCSLETLNKKRKVNAVGKINGKCNIVEKDAKRAAKESNPVNDNSELQSSDSQQDASSTGRFKTGSFDLEQHIASLPKCDIEVLNKRRNKKE